MVASSEIGWLEQVLRGHVARFMPGDEGGGSVQAPVREVLTAPELSQDEQWALDEWEEGVHSGRSVGDLLLEARINAAVQLQADAMARSLGMEETPEVPPVHVARSKEKSSDESLVASLTNAGVLQEAEGGLSVSRLTSESTFVFTDGGGYEALRHLKLDPNQTDFVDEGREAKLAEAHKALTIVQSMHGLDAVEECIKQALPRYEELAQKEPIELEEKDLTGEVLGGKYRVKRALGKGGFGTVYEAVDEMLGAPVAIKVLNPKAAGHDRALEQFLDEAKLLTNLDHPNIVRWITFDKRKDGQHYFVMEYLHGEELSEILKREGRLAPERVLQMLIEIVDALRAAHHLPDGSALYHLDLKPQNVFVVSGEPERVKVIDFGISQHVGAEAREAAGVEVMSAPDKPGQDLSATIASQITPAVASDSRAGVSRARGGTLLYASPEQCKHLAGHADIVDLDGRSDLYSVGIMAFQLLTGDMPFQHLRTPLDAIDSHLNVAPRKPSDLKVDVPRKLADFVARSLAKDRDDRFADAEEAYAALDRIANPPSRWPWIAAAAAVVAVPAAWIFWPEAPLEAFDVVGAGHVFLGPETRSDTLDIGKLVAEGTEVRFVSDTEGGEELLVDWQFERTTEGDIRIAAPENLADTIEASAYLEVFGKGRPQSSDVKLDVVYLGAEAWSLDDVSVEGWDGEKVLDPTGAALEITVRPLDLGGDVDFVSQVLVSLNGGDERPAEPVFADSTRTRKVYRIRLDDFPNQHRGEMAATLHVEVTDRAGNVKTQDVPVVLDARKLAFDAVALEGGPIELRPGEYRINPRHAPVLVVHPNRPAKVDIQVRDEDGTELPVTVEETSAGRYELSFSGGAAAGAILISADDSESTHHTQSSRGQVSADLRFEYVTDLPTVRHASPTAFEYDLPDGTRGYVTNEQSFVLNLNRDDVEVTVEAMCTPSGGEEALEPQRLDLHAKKNDRLTFALPADGLYDLALGLHRRGSDTAEAREATFVLLDTSGPEAWLSGAANLVLKAENVEDWSVDLMLTEEESALALPVTVDWTLRRQGSIADSGSLEDQTISAQPIVLDWARLGIDPSTLADGSYELAIGGRDKAGNELRVVGEAHAFELARVGPDIDDRHPGNLANWSRHEANLFTLRVAVSDPNGVQEVRCTVGPLEGERTSSQALELDSGIEWQTVVELPPDWARTRVRIEVTAWDLHGIEGETTIDADLPDFGLPRHPLVYVEITDAPEVPIGDMRLVDGGRYLFGGAGDSAEKGHFVNYGEATPAYFTDNDDQSWVNSVDIGDFYLDETEVTVEQFLAFVDHPQGYRNRANWKKGERPTDSLPIGPDEERRRALATEFGQKKKDLPVTDVTWYEACAYAEWVGKRLPTFDEWQYAVRGGSAYRPHSFAVKDGTKAVEVNYDDRDTGPWPVSRGDDVTSSEEVGGGIKDLCSNVSEWTAWFTPFEAGDGKPGTYAVGASYRDSNCFFYKATRKAPERAWLYVGFRCALDFDRVGRPDPRLKFRGSGK